MISGIDLLIPKGLYVYFGILELINNLLVSSPYFTGGLPNPDVCGDFPTSYSGRHGERTPTTGLRKKNKLKYSAKELMYDQDSGLDNFEDWLIRYYDPDVVRDVDFIRIS